MEVWPYSPQATITESLEWMTDIQRCRSAEYRQCLRLRPRQELQLKFLMTQEEFSKAKLVAKRLGTESSQTAADLILYGATPFSLWVPLWPMAYRTVSIASGSTHIPKDVDDPVQLTRFGSVIMVWESPSKYEVLGVSVNSVDPEDPYITTYTATTQAYTSPWVIPLRVGELAQEFEATRSTFQKVETSVRFRVIAGDDYSDEPGDMYAAYRYGNHPLVIDRSLLRSGVKEQYQREFEEVDSEIGNAWRFPSFSIPDQSGQMTWHAQGRENVRALLYWLHSRKGRWKSFWIPSWSGDITVTHEIAASDTTIEITDIGMRTRGVFPFDIMILGKDGSRTCCQVTSAAAGSTGKEVITVSAQVGAHLYTWDIDKVCMLTLYRFESDRIEITHESGMVSTVSTSVVEVPA